MAASVLAPSAGCLVDRGARAEISDLHRQIDVYRREAAASQQKAEDLENRVFVLEDRVETQKVADDRAAAAEPRLPVVKKVGPSSSANAPVATPAAPDAAVDRYTDANGEEVVVIYEGDAARRTPARPQIRIDGSGRADSLQPVDEPAARTSLPRPRRSKAAVAQAEPVPAAPAGAAIAAEADGDDAIGLYKSSYQALTRREHATAIAGFQKFLGRYADHDYADNAQYWLGEAYYDQRDYQTALAEFRKVVKRYPDGNKAPDALLKIGYCYAKLGDLDAARDVLSQVIEIYPKTDSAKLAGTRLEEMRR
jgi:tol-pal system protein YbgF